MSGIDWSRGPVPCAGCGRLLRPTHIHAGKAGWEHTTAYGSQGECITCTRRRRRDEAQAAQREEARAAAQEQPAPPTLRRLASLGREVTWPWRITPGGVSMIQQELEALADLADQLRREGLVAMSRPRRTVRHGRDAVILLTLTVRPATPEEARALGHDPQGGEQAEVAA